MKTTLVKDLGYEMDEYPLEDLENGAELRALIQECESTLKPCIHCGREHPRIIYAYRPKKRVTPGKDTPHEVYVCCEVHRRSKDETFSCGIQTTRIYAEDDLDYADFKEALRVIAALWNQRPGDPVDPVVKQIRSSSSSPFYFGGSFKSMDEMQAWFKRRTGQPFERGRVYKFDEEGKASMLDKEKVDIDSCFR